MMGTPTPSRYSILLIEAMEAVYSIQDQMKADRNLTRVEAVYNENYTPHGTKSYVSLLQKYGIGPTKEGPYFRADHTEQKCLSSEQSKSTKDRHKKDGRVLYKRDSFEPSSRHGEVTAQDSQNDMLYLGEVSIGTPAQNLMLDFDTGSADFWVYSPALSSIKGKGHNVFNPKESSTYEPLAGKGWKIEYGDGSTASGDCGTDTLVIGGLSVEKQTVENAKELSDGFIQSAGDGLLGLGFSKINAVTEGDKADPKQTLVENMMQQKDIPTESSLFTSAFYSYRDAEPNRSFYTFGYIDQDLVRESGEDIHWVDVDSSGGFWSFASESVSINGKSMAMGSGTAIADTGTTLALMSDAVVDALYGQIPGATYDWASQGYVFPITITLEDLPDFKVAVGEKEFIIQKEDLAFAPTEDGENWYGGIQSRGDLPFNIYGDTFLKSIYAIWDQGNQRFGAVPKIEEIQTMKTPPVTTPPISGGPNADWATNSRASSFNMLSGKI